MVFWLRNVWRQSSTRRLLVWDSFSGHKTKNVKQLLVTRYNLDIAIIPGGCTSTLQPCDVSWNKPFKDHYRDLYDKWLYSCRFNNEGWKSSSSGENIGPPMD